ncbi:Protein-tyrosine-phosphatase PTP1 [Hibiscus syriacus]|uniref:Protein-tyrosine-phosphatase PTP1 n=1 Tax=Hibiscus syriacus TaxID=106335 RepID=A0A6A3CL49_HIBSY|nr:Protein-tyrosine-phosphatase PTP1 [Hibiscus syriacus]
MAAAAANLYSDSNPTQSNPFLQTPLEIIREFSLLQANRVTSSEMMRRCTVGLNGVNMDKNRYSDVVPFDANRIVLNSCKDYRPASMGYINASFITISSSENISQFIATQGSLPHTYEDFWEMVIQCHCPVIVMLTRLVDNYKACSLNQKASPFKVWLVHLSNWS